MTVEEIIAKYIELRDKKDAIKDKAKQETAAIDDLMNRIEAKLLDAFNKLGVDSFKTGVGTAYTINQTSATVADKEIFMDYVKDNQEWSLLEVRAAKLAVEQFIEANDKIPPGLNWRTSLAVGIRRKSS